MFEQIPSNLPVSREPEDILEKVAPSAPAAAPPQRPIVPPPAPRVETVALETPRQGMKRLVFVLGIVFGVVIVGGASWFLISKSLKTKSVEVAAPEPAPPAPEPENAFPVEPTPSPESVFPVAPTAPPVSAPLDTDGDGLSDADEAALGTNINLIDSDNDGLTDYEEVNVYKTNPLNPDSDGDKYLDGQEVRSGYNPNGPGQLLPPPSP